LAIDGEENNPLSGAANKGKNVAKEAAKQNAKRLAKAAIKAGVKLAGRAALYLIGLISWPVVIVILIVLIMSVLMAAFYGSMPATATLTGVNASQYDQVIQQEAVNDVSAWNVKNTWLVSGESGVKKPWYPGTGSQNFGKLMDEYGQDQELENQWGDIYAPVLYQAAQVTSENATQDQAWTDNKLDAAAQNLKPWFYYKQSQITTTTVGRNGHSTTTTTTVYLLVEAYTIRGHWQYHYAWTTRSLPNGGSETYEKLSGSQEISDGMDCLKKYLLTAYQIPDDNNADLVTQATFQMAQGFTAEEEEFEALEADPNSAVYRGGRIYTSPQELKYQPVHADVVAVFMNQYVAAEGGSYLAQQPGDIQTIINAAQAHGLNPLLLIAITGQEQSFDPINQDTPTDDYLISQDPFNYGGCWNQWDGTLAESANNTANKLAGRLSTTPPVGEGAIEWINDPNNTGDDGLYAVTDGQPTPGWWEGVNMIFQDLNNTPGIYTGPTPNS
jgi:hypothetical protein